MPARESAYRPSLVSGSLLRFIALEYKEVMADTTWLQAVQFLGNRDKALRKKQDDQVLYDLINRVTDLDARFEYAYIFGAISLSVLSDEINLSNALLQKGIKNNIRNWNIPFLLAFNHFYHLQDYSKAAYYINLASRIEGSPPYFPFLAARFYAKGGDPQTAILFLKGVYLSTKDEKMREKIAERIAEIEKNLDLGKERGNN